MLSPITDSSQQKISNEKDSNDDENQKDYYSDVEERANAMDIFDAVASIGRTSDATELYKNISFSDMLEDTFLVNAFFKVSL